MYGGRKGGVVSPSMEVGTRVVVLEQLHDQLQVLDPCNNIDIVFMQLFAHDQQPVAQPPTSTIELEAFRAVSHRVGHTGYPQDAGSLAEQLEDSHFHVVSHRSVKPGFTREGQIWVKGASCIALTLDPQSYEGNRVSCGTSGAAVNTSSPRSRKATHDAGHEASSIALGTGSGQGNMNPLLSSYLAGKGVLPSLSNFTVCGAHLEGHCSDQKNCPYIHIPAEFEWCLLIKDSTGEVVLIGDRFPDEPAEPREHVFPGAQVYYAFWTRPPRKGSEEAPTHSCLWGVSFACYALGGAPFSACDCAPSDLLSAVLLHRQPAEEEEPEWQSGGILSGIEQMPKITKEYVAEQDGRTLRLFMAAMRVASLSARPFEHLRVRQFLRGAATLGARATLLTAIASWRESWGLMHGGLFGASDNTVIAKLTWALLSVSDPRVHETSAEAVMQSVARNGCAGLLEAFFAIASSGFPVTVLRMPVEPVFVPGYVAEDEIRVPGARSLKFFAARQSTARVDELNLVGGFATDDMTPLGSKSPVSLFATDRAYVKYVPHRSFSMVVTEQGSETQQLVPAPIQGRLRITCVASCWHVTSSAGLAFLDALITLRPEALVDAEPSRTSDEEEEEEEEEEEKEAEEEEEEEEEVVAQADGAEREQEQVQQGTTGKMSMEASTAYADAALSASPVPRRRLQLEPEEHRRRRRRSEVSGEFKVSVRLVVELLFSATLEARGTFVLGCMQLITSLLSRVPILSLADMDGYRLTPLWRVFHTNLENAPHTRSSTTAEFLRCAARMFYLLEQVDLVVQGPPELEG